MNGRDPRFGPGCAVFVLLILAAVLYGAVIGVAFVTRSPDGERAPGLNHDSNLQGTGQ